MVKTWRVFLKITKHIKNLRTDKSPDTDGVQNMPKHWVNSGWPTNKKLLKTSNDVVTRSLANLFKKVLETGQVPKQWKICKTILLFKKENFRHIAIYHPIYTYIHLIGESQVYINFLNQFFKPN